MFALIIICTTAVVALEIPFEERYTLGVDYYELYDGDEVIRIKGPPPKSAKLTAGAIEEIERQQQQPDSAKGCGAAIRQVDKNGPRSWCNFYSAGVPGCTRSVYIYYYSCFPNCMPGAYNGVAWICDAGHMVDMGGKIAGICN